MAITKIKDSDLTDKGVIGMADVPGLTTTEMQRKMEEISTDVIIPKVNEVIEAVNEQNSNLSADSMWLKSVSQGTAIEIDINGCRRISGYFNITHNSEYHRVPFSIDCDFLIDNDRAFYIPYYYSSEYYCCIAITVSKTSFKYSSALNAGITSTTCALAGRKY